MSCFEVLVTAVAFAVSRRSGRLVNQFVDLGQHDALHLLTQSDFSVLQFNEVGARLVVDLALGLFRDGLFAWRLIKFVNVHRGVIRFRRRPCLGLIFHQFLQLLPECCENRKLVSFLSKNFANNFQFISDEILT